MMEALRFAVRDTVADWRRSVVHIWAIVPMVVAYLIMIAVAGGLRGDAVELELQNIVLLSPNALDPASGRLDPAALELAAEVGGSEVTSVTPMIFRPIRVDDRIVQLRAAPIQTWQEIHGLTLLSGSWPVADDEIVITEGIAIATDWDLGTRVEIFGTTFTISALLRAPGTKFASVWMDFQRADRLFEGQSGFQMVTIKPAPGADFLSLHDRLEVASEGEYSVYFEDDLAERQTARAAAAESIAAVATIVGVAALIFGGFNLAALALSERRRDLGIARSIGFSRRTVGTVALLRSAMVASVGYLVGGVLALGALSLTAAATLRSFVFEPSIPASAWFAGAAITVFVSILGSLLALRNFARQQVRALLETW